jgi:hypothetical protein
LAARVPLLLQASTSSTVGNIVDQTVSMFTSVIKSLLPTPARVHYTFNLRDLAKVFQGMLMNNVKSLQGETDVVRSWVHECNRVFRDRLINDEDRAFFDGELQVRCKDVFGIEWADINPTAVLLYGDFMDPSQDPRLYQLLPDTPQIKEVRLALTQSVQCAVCRVQCAVCCVLCAVCCVRCAVCCALDMSESDMSDSSLPDSDMYDLYMDDYGMYEKKINVHNQDPI